METQAYTFQEVSRNIQKAQKTLFLQVSRDWREVDKMMESNLWARGLHQVLALIEWPRQRQTEEENTGKHSTSARRTQLTIITGAIKAGDPQSRNPNPRNCPITLHKHSLHSSTDSGLKQRTENPDLEEQKSRA